MPFVEGVGEGQVRDLDQVAAESFERRKGRAKGRALDAAGMEDDDIGLCAGAADGPGEGGGADGVVGIGDEGDEGVGHEIGIQWIKGGVPRAPHPPAGTFSPRGEETRGIAAVPSTVALA